MAHITSFHPSIFFELTVNHCPNRKRLRSKKLMDLPSHFEKQKIQPTVFPSSKASWISPPFLSLPRPTLAPPAPPSARCFPLWVSAPLSHFPQGLGSRACSYPRRLAVETEAGRTQAEMGELGLKSWTNRWGKSSLAAISWGKRWINHEDVWFFCCSSKQLKQK